MSILSEAKMLDLFTVVWDRVGGHRGLTHLYCEVTLPSLMQPGNLPEARNVVGSYRIYADDSSRAIITQSDYYREMEKLVRVSWHGLCKGPGDVNSNIVEQMRYSAQRGNHMLIVSPDWLFGNGSIANMAHLCQEGNYQLILFGFPKVDPKVFYELGNKLKKGDIISNRELVSVGITSGGCPIHIIAHNGNDWIVSFRVPTPCLRPDSRIIDFFATNDTPNQGYDHALPYWMIEQGYSWHMVDNSDIFFLVEEAQAWQGGSGPWGLDLLSKTDQFFRNYRQVWRGENARPAYNYMG